MNEADGEEPPTSLDELVASVATRLMRVDASNLASVSERVLRDLVDHLGLDLSFLRFNDHERRATVLVAEWPPRENVPDPDPLGVIYFEGADPIFAATEHLSEVMFVRPDTSGDDYQRRVEDASGMEVTTSVGVPLLGEGRTTGLLGLVKFGDRNWDDDEVRALRTIALLLAQTRAQLRAAEKLRHIAHHDELTGLPNRRALLAFLAGTLSSPEPGPRALLFVDVDRLKAMNDFLGHEAGDRFIVAVADRLRAAVGPTGMVARLGGDEFVVALAGTADEEKALRVADDIQAEMTEPMRLGGQSLGRTVSLGLALAWPGVTPVAEWLRNADQAVLAAKERGGNTVSTFTVEMAEREQMRVAVEMNLLPAIRTGLLVVHYQPIVDLSTDRMIGAEALLRWNHPTLGPVPPELFVGVAEATNMAGELGEWVLHEACRQLAEWRRTVPGPDGADLVMSVNVSPVQLISVDFVDTVVRVLDRHGLAGHDLILEVVEHAVVSDAPAALATLQGLRRLGVAIAIDDFGTGYSSLAQLKALPVTILKIDRGFVRDLGANEDDLAIVRSIVGLAESFGLQLVAEGVENRAAADLLLRMGCHKAQGFLFSRPVPPDDIRDRLATPVGDSDPVGAPC